LLRALVLQVWCTASAASDSSAGVTPHIAQKRQCSALDHRTTRTAGDAISQRKRKLVEQAFGWMKAVGLRRKLRYRGVERVDWVFTFTAAAYNMSDCDDCCPSTRDQRGPSDPASLSSAANGPRSAAPAALPAPPASPARPDQRATFEF
jgi:hypothetical protein